MHDAASELPVSLTPIPIFGPVRIQSYPNSKKPPLFLIRMILRSDTPVSFDVYRCPGSLLLARGVGGWGLGVG